MPTNISMPETNGSARIRGDQARQTTANIRQSFEHATKTCYHPVEPSPDSSLVRYPRSGRLRVVRSRLFHFCQSNFRALDKYPNVLWVPIKASDL
jgi:hypothetical protein